MKKATVIIITCIIFFSCLPESKNEIEYEKLFRVKDNDTIKYINIDGVVVLNYSYAPEDIDLFYPNEGLIGFRTENKMGYLNYDFEIEIEPEYDSAAPFINNYAIIGQKINNKMKFGYINIKGNIIIEPQYDKAGAFYNNVAKVGKRINGKMKFGLINTKAEIVSDYIFDDIKRFSEDLALVEVNGHIGYIDQQGVIVIEPIFEPTSDIESSNFKEGFALVLKDGKHTYIDKNGKIIAQLEADHARPFHDGMAVFYRKNINNHNEVGFIDSLGKIAIKPIYAWSSDFSDGFAPVYYGDNYGPMDPSHNDMYYIDKSGEKAFDKEFYSCGIFSEGLAFVQMNNANNELEWFAINTNGEFEFKLPDYVTHTSPFNNGLAQITIQPDQKEKNTMIKKGYVNLKGEIIWEPTN